MNINKMPSQRQMRFGELIRSIISESFLKQDFFDVNVDMSRVTVSFVKMSKDLKVASVYVMPLGGKDKEKMINILNEKKYFFQKSISQAKLKSKFTPKINFYIDDTYEEAEKIKNLLLDTRVLRDLNDK